MPKKSVVSKIVRKSAKDVPRASAADLKRLRAAMKGRIDTSEIPERRKFRRLNRIKLSARDSLLVMDLLENPPAPNAKLLKAARARLDRS